MDIVKVGSANCLSLGKEEWVRKLPFGSNWTRLRFSVWLTTTAVGDLTIAQFMLGVCEGPYGWHSAQMTDCFCSAYPRPEGGSRWLSGDGPPVDYFADTGEYMAWKLNGVVQAAATPNAGPPHTYADGTTFGHCGFDIVRGNATGACQVSLLPYQTSGGLANDPKNNYTYLAAGEADCAPSAPPYGTRYGGSSWIPFTYTGAGNFNHVFMSWTNNSPKMLIRMVNIVRFSA